MKYLKPLLIIVLSAITIAACNDKSNKDAMHANEQENASSKAAQDKMNDHSMDDDMMSGNTIVAVAAENANLSTLVKAIKHADNEHMLREKGPFTVFAPTNDAFDALPQGTVDTLMKQENMDHLRDILAYHVVRGSMKAADLKDGQVVSTVQGAKLKITNKNGTVMVNGAKVVDANVEASNGVIHIIDKVLLPSK